MGINNPNIPGNAATADLLRTSRLIGGVSFNGGANINLPGVNAAGNQSTSGNAASATVLQTARLIGGVSFNGSANINLPGVNAPGNQNTSGNAATATNAGYATNAGTAAACSGNAATATSATLINGIPFRSSTTQVETPDSVASNGIGYVNGLSVLGRTDGALYNQRYSGDFAHQIFGDYRTGQIALRGNRIDDGSGWTSWRIVLDSSNYNAYAPSLAGVGASGTWAINITGNASNSSAVGGQSIAALDTRYSTDRPQSGLGVVGSYAFMRIESGGLSLAPGATAAGSNLRYGSLNGATDVRTTGVVPAGTWRCCGGGPVVDTLYTVFQRIA